MQSADLRVAMLHHCNPTGASNLFFFVKFDLKMSWAFGVLLLSVE